MPYILPTEQEPYHLNLTHIRAELKGKPKGHLTFIAFVLARAFAEDRGLGYTSISEAISALENAAHEMRRRDLDRWEDEKLQQNGDAIL
jgi:hypothetical protein